MYINKVFLFGNLTRDPELRALPNGGSVASFSIATNRQFKKADGSKQEQTEFSNIVVFGKQAESCAQYLKKGSSAYIEGRLQTRSWESEEKGKQYRTEIVAERVQFGPRPPSSGTERANPRSPDKGTANSEIEPNTDELSIQYPEEDINPDDIAF